MDPTDCHREEAQDVSQPLKCAASQRGKAHDEESDVDEVTKALNELYAEECSAMDPVIAQMQWLSLSKEDW